MRTQTRDEQYKPLVLSEALKQFEDKTTVLDKIVEIDLPEEDKDNTGMRVLVIFKKTFLTIRQIQEFE